MTGCWRWARRSRRPGSAGSRRCPWRSAAGPGDLDGAATLMAQALPVFRGTVLTTSWALEVIGWIAAGRGRHERAAVLLGAAEALALTRMGTRAAKWPGLLTYHDQVRQQTHAALGDQ